MKMKVVYIATLLLILHALSCNTTEPIDEVKPGRRDYEWTVDTLDAPYDTYYRMWANSPSDVWCTSPGDWDKSIAHFDGKKWSLYGVSGIIAPRSVYGFSSNSILICAENGKIWRFDGNEWKLFFELKKSKEDWISLNNMWGESINNFFAFGSYYNNEVSNSLVANYKDGSWIIFDTNELTGIVGCVYKNKSDNKIYLQAYRVGNGEYYDSTLIYEYSQGNYKQLYGGVWTQGLQADISLINDEVYFIMGDEIAIRKENQFRIKLKVNNPNFYQRIWGRSSKDIFLMMTNGLCHFNGINIEYLFAYPFRTQIFGAALFDKEVFFLVYESSKNLNLIYHGKLKE